MQHLVQVCQRLLERLWRTQLPLACHSTRRALPHPAALQEEVIQQIRYRHQTSTLQHPLNNLDSGQPHLSLGVSPARMTLSDVAMHSTSSPLMYACGTFAAR